MIFCGQILFSKVGKWTKKVGKLQKIEYFRFVNFGEKCKMAKKSGQMDTFKIAKWPGFSLKNLVFARVFRFSGQKPTFFIYKSFLEKSGYKRMWAEKSGKVGRTYFPSIYERSCLP